MTENPWESRQRERKASALIATILQLDPRPTPEAVDHWTRTRWVTVAKIGHVKPPSEKTVALTQERYRKVWLLRNQRQETR